MANGIIRLDDGWRMDEGHHFDEPPNVPPPVLPPAPPPSQKGKHMDFVPDKRAERYLWLKNLSDQVVAEAVKFGAPAGDATAAKALADHLLAKMEATDAAEAARDGARTVERAAQKADVAGLRLKVRNWKTLAGWGTSGSEGVLKVKGSEVAFDPSTYKPKLKVTLEGGVVVVGFVLGEADGVNIYARLRGTAAWRKLGMDTSSPYLDASPLAQPGVPEAREYLARGVLDDVEIGQDSDIVSMTVG